MKTLFHSVASLRSKMVKRSPHSRFDSFSFLRSRHSLSREGIETQPIAPTSSPERELIASHLPNGHLTPSQQEEMKVLKEQLETSASPPLPLADRGQGAKAAVFDSEETVQKKLIHTTVLRMALLRLAMKGVPSSKAAEILGCSKASARAHYADPTFKRAVYEKVREAFGEIDEAFEEVSKTLHERIQEQALKSFQDLVSMLGRTDLAHAHRIKINQDFLNRCEESQPLAKHTTQLEPSALVRASQVAKEMEAAASGKLIYIEKGEKAG